MIWLVSSTLAKHAASKILLGLGSSFEVIGRETNEAKHALVESSASGVGVRVPFHGSDGRAG